MRLSIAALICLLFLAAAMPSRALVIADPQSIEHHRSLALGLPYARVGEMGGGVAISERWVLTAAHVAQELIPGVASVHIHGVDYPVIEVVVSDRFRSPDSASGIAHDIALVGLAGAVNHRSMADVFCGQLRLGQDVMVIGAGDVRDRFDRPVELASDGTLLAGKNRIVGLTPQWTDIGLMKGAEEPMWAVSAGGDSGSPMLFSEQGRWSVVGVSSHYPEAPDDLGNRLDRYTTVASHCAWIESVVVRPPVLATSITASPEDLGPAASLAWQWVDAYNAGFDHMQSFNGTSLSSSMKGRRSIEQQRKRYQALRKQWGALEIVQNRTSPLPNSSLLVVNSEHAGTLALIFSVVDESGLKLDSIATLD